MSVMAADAADRIARPDWRHRRAAAVRRAKVRKRHGLAVLRIEVALGPLADQLVADKFVGEWDAENRAAVEQGLERMLGVYIQYGNTLPWPRNR
jgi:hypothetical protein